MESNLTNSILGLATGDALGLQYEGKDRAAMKASPVTGPEFQGEESEKAYPVKDGVWSDLTSMNLATLDSLVKGLDYEDIMQKFLIWRSTDDYMSTMDIFRMDSVVNQAIDNYTDDVVAVNCGLCNEEDPFLNSVLPVTRMAPIAYYLESKYSSEHIPEATEEEMQVVHDVCCLTHKNLECQVACGIYVMLLRVFHCGITPARKALLYGLALAFDYYDNHAEFAPVMDRFAALRNLSEENIPSEDSIPSGKNAATALYEAVWSVFVTTTEIPAPSDSYDSFPEEVYAAVEGRNPYSETVLRAVNLGGATPEIAALAGSLAGIIYGYDNIKEDWKSMLPFRAQIEEYCDILTGPPQKTEEDENEENFAAMADAAES